MCSSLTDTFWCSQKKLFTGRSTDLKIASLVKFDFFIFKSIVRLLNNFFKLGFLRGISENSKEQNGDSFFFQLKVFKSIDWSLNIFLKIRILPCTIIMNKIKDWDFKTNYRGQNIVMQCLIFSDRGKYDGVKKTQYPKYFSVSVDSTSDASHIVQLPIVLRKALSHSYSFCQVDWQALSETRKQ